MDMASIQKAMLNIITERADVYVFDKNTFTQLAAQGLLIPLDEKVKGPWKEQLQPDQLMTSRTNEDTEDHVYGIDVSRSKLVDMPPKSDEYIVGIRADTERKDQSYESSVAAREAVEELFFPLKSKKAAARLLSWLLYSHMRLERTVFTLKNQR